MSILSRKNLEKNRLIEKKLASGKLINGQRLEPVSEMRYGLCPLSFNGCECIAVFNALIYIKKPKPLSEIIYRLERHKMLSGIFGCNPYKLGEVLGEYGAAFERTEDMNRDGCCIVSFWTGKPFLSSIHTVFCLCTKGRAVVYNRFGGCGDVRYYSSLNELIKNRKPIALYYIENQTA